MGARRVLLLSALGLLVLVYLCLRTGANVYSVKLALHTSVNMETGWEEMLEYAPIVYLDEEEEYFPSDFGTFLEHVVPFHGTKPLSPLDYALSLDNLDELNQNGNSGKDIFLTARDDPTTSPRWLHGQRPIDGKTDSTRVITIFVKKHVSEGDGPLEEVVDMFSFYFYSFNAGPRIPNSKKFFGNHVGDLEHSVVRFRHGSPESVYLSRHASGNLFAYTAITKENKRPVLYAGRGTHALYAVAGENRYIMPDGSEILDFTSKGHRWDPLHTAVVFSFSQSSQEVTALRPASQPTRWFKFLGHWGDATFKPDDPRQGIVAGQRLWSDGPTFAIKKNLERAKSVTNACPMETKLQVETRKWGT